MKLRIAVWCYLSTQTPMTTVVNDDGNHEQFVLHNSVNQTMLIANRVLLSIQGRQCPVVCPDRWAVFISTTH